MRRASLKFLRNNNLLRQHDFTLRLRGLSENSARRIQQINFAERLANLFTLCGQKRIRHAARNNENIDLLNKIAQKFELGRNFRAAYDSSHRTLRLFKRL